MDNKNDPNSQNNTNPASPFGAPAQPLQPSSIPSWSPPQASIATDTATPVPGAWPVPADTEPTPSSQTVTPTPISTWPSDQTPPVPVIPTINTESIPTPPEPTQIPSDPGQTATVSGNGSMPDFNSAWMTPVQTTSTPAAAAPEPLPSVESPASQFSPDTIPVPEQTPAQPEPMPTFAPTNTQAEQSVPTPAQPSWAGIPESAPTDLSHLITNNSQQNLAEPGPETLVVPPNPTSNPEVPTMPAEGHKGIPKWLYGVGGGLLILVIGASAYFILGIGQPAKTTSLPATTASTTEEVNPPQPVNTPVAQPAGQSAASGSANFGEVGGSTQPQQAATGSSVIETLRQRQQTAQ